MYGRPIVAVEEDKERRLVTFTNEVGQHVTFTDEQLRQMRSLRAPQPPYLQLKNN